MSGEPPGGETSYPPLSKSRASLIRGLASASGRAHRGLFVADGVKVVGEALAGAMPVVEVVATAAALPALGRWSERLAGVRVSVTDERTFAQLVESRHPQGVLAVVQAAAHGLADLPAAGPILLLDRIQDPGNAGTLLRSHRATGGQGVIALRGTVDCLNEKVVRASVGALFSLTIAAHVEVEVALGWCAARMLPVLALDPAGRPLFDAAWVAPESFALAVGNEGVGLSDALLVRAAERLAIPMSGGVESLNAGVAGSIALFELARRRGAMAGPPPA